MKSLTALPTILAWDTETERFRAGMMAPELTCVTWASTDDRQPRIEHWTKAEPLLRGWLSDPDLLLVGQNIAYDMAVICAAFPNLIPLVFKAYAENRITDTMIRAQLMDIAAGCFRGYMGTDGVWRKLSYGLDVLVRKHTGEILQKDGWRLRYGEFRHVPLNQWVDKARELQAEARALLQREAGKPLNEQYYNGHEAKDLLAIVNDAPEQVILYPLKDASSTLDVYLAQERVPPEMLVSQYRETRAAFALHLSSTWGIRTDGLGVDAFEQETRKDIEEAEALLRASGLLRADGSRDTKKAASHMELVCERDSLPLRLTKGKGVCLDADACEETQDPLLLAYAQYSTLNKRLTADIPMLRQGTMFPIHTKYNLVYTGRTSSSGPNLQNLARS